MGDVDTASGDELDVMTPTGRFTVALDPAQRKRYVAIAAGSGITPVMSLASTILEVELHSSVSLVYANRTTNSIMFLEELLDLKNRYPQRFEIVNVLSREAQDVEILSGRLDRERLSMLLDALIPVDSVDEVLCGPYELVQTARTTAGARRRPPSRPRRAVPRRGHGAAISKHGHARGARRGQRGHRHARRSIDDILAGT